MSDHSEETGVLFPSVDGRRSTQTTARAVFADATRSVAPDVASAIERSGNWHKDYVRHLAEIERVSASSAKAATIVATEGLHALHERMVFVRDGEEVELADALDRWQQP